ncbi:5-carboxymethyl-2-hydroxymuconate isomerase [Tepidicella baoligensis]|uniref:5-carboxymethyl-2-hydroxymuconate isomerase n=1 Tax=Tepidicella baoligensis TaxID=2707016 RepID=UPI0015D971E0|nr:5-carboxymethyl-2-hydroxymuconate isomerase [Tepidicella baoligensis]
MPHLVILYTGQLDAETDIGALCRTLANTMLAVRDEDDRQVFPAGGTRVLAYPAAHYAVADGGAAGRAVGGDGDYAFVYLNLRMGRGRSATTHRKLGDALLMATKAHFQPLFSRRHIGVTLQIDEGQEVFDAKHSNLHPLFNPKA